MVLTDLTPSELKDWVTTRGFPVFRARQLLHWVYERGCLSASAMHNLPGDFQTLLNETGISPLCEYEKQTSRDGTSKIAFQLPDNAIIESVLIPMQDSFTFCISSQVGCAMTCRFCATAALGFSRNLQTSEMVSQVLHLRNLMARANDRFNVVFMGMGEPLLNMEAVLKTIEILTSHDGMGLSPSRITLSTCGIIPGLKELAKQKIRPRIALSLNAPDTKLREELMPVTRSNPLPEVLEVLRRFPLGKRERITMEYVLIRDINDSLQDARNVVRILNGIRCKVNLIPFNPFPGSGMKKPLDENVFEFQHVLTGKGLTAMVRRSKGVDIQGACGQLAARHQTCTTKKKDSPG